jgi:hypothetical protein
VPGGGPGVREFGGCGIRSLKFGTDPRTHIRRPRGFLAAPTGKWSAVTKTHGVSYCRHDAKKNLIYPFASLRLGVFAFPFLPTHDEIHPRTLPLSDLLTVTPDLHGGRQRRPHDGVDEAHALGHSDRLLRLYLVPVRLQEDMRPHRAGFDPPRPIRR